jgi:hypothetical protein
MRNEFLSATHAPRLLHGYDFPEKFWMIKNRCEMAVACLKNFSILPGIQLNYPAISSNWRHIPA